MSFFSLILNSLPPLSIILIATYSYYTYVVLYCLSYLNFNNVVIYSLVAFHFFMIMFLWCFLRTICADHSPVPLEYTMDAIDHNQIMQFNELQLKSMLKKVIIFRELDIYTCTSNGGIRYCKQCRQLKPDRCHHCSTCKKCVLKMDHHCPWVSNCVGFSNYKFFLLMLLYGLGWSVVYITSVGTSIMALWTDCCANLKPLSLLTGFVVAILMAILISLLLVYHIGIMWKNETTLESFRATVFFNDNDTFNLGACNNILEVFGENCCFWLIPIQSSLGNGHEFPVRSIE